MSTGLPYPEVGLQALRRKPSFAALERASVRLVRTVDELLQAFAIRSAVFMAEQVCPYHEEFDGNDLAGCHLVASVENEPVATLRLRWFASFGKVERVCILPAARGKHLERVLLAHAFELASRKGFRLMTGQIQARLWPMWQKTIHCTLRDNRPSFAFSDFEYLEIDIPMPSHPKSISPLSDPYLLIRPEGSWDATGILEASVERSDERRAAA